MEDSIIQPPRALILAAGEGTRLRPLTLDRPKPMVPIAGRPLLEHTIAWLRSHGVCEIAINLHHCPEAIVRHFGDGAACGVRITYSYEERLLGTAGAVRRLAGFFAEEPFLVIYGDVLTDLDLGRLLAFHRDRARRDPRIAATIGLYRVPNPTEVGLVGLGPDGRVTRFLEKPRPAEVFTDLANTGILVVEPHVIAQIPAGVPYDFGRDLFPQLLAAGASLYGWIIPADAYLLDIGAPEKYAQAQRDWANRGP